MRHQYDRATARFEELLQPLDGLYVEVVGRLVQQEDVRTFQQDLSQFDTHTPTTTELARLAGEVGADESETQERLLHLALEVVHAHHVQALVGVREALYQLLV